MAKELIAQLKIGGADLNQLSRIAAALARIFIAHGLTLAEINPLAKLEDGRFVCLDGHVDMEDDARDSQKAILKALGIAPEEKRQARPPTQFEIDGAAVDASDHRGVAGNVVEFDGDLGLVIGAGGGSLTLFDAIRKHGGKPANYCEIGGNPSVTKACELTKLILAQAGREEDRGDDERRFQHARRHRRARRHQGRRRVRPQAVREDRHLPHPRLVGDRGFQDPPALRRRVLRPDRVDVRGRRPRSGEDEGMNDAGRTTTALAVVHRP